MVSIGLPSIEAENKALLLEVVLIVIGEYAWCGTCPSFMSSCTLSSTRIWMVPSVKASSKNGALSF